MRASVAGTTSFTVTAAGSDLLIGPQALGYSGQANNLVGALTISTSGAGAYRDILVRNTNAGAGTISGLAGSFRNVALVYDNASSLTVPGMTLSGTLLAKAQSQARCSQRDL